MRNVLIKSVLSYFILKDGLFKILLQEKKQSDSQSEYLFESVENCLSIRERAAMFKMATVTLL